MASSGMLRCVALVRVDVSEELSSSIRVTRIGELGTVLAVTSNRGIIHLPVCYLKNDVSGGTYSDVPKCVLNT
jgi:hypothetical protein